MAVVEVEINRDAAGRVTSATATCDECDLRATAEAPPPEATDERADSALREALRRGGCVHTEGRFGAKLSFGPHYARSATK
jgi:hypothetical protein